MPQFAGGAAICCSEHVREHRSVVTPPLALEALVRVVRDLETQEFDEVGIAGLDLLARRPAVIRQVVTAAAFASEVDQFPKGSPRALDARRVVIDVQIDHDAGPALARPSQEARAIALDQTD